MRVPGREITIFAGLDANHLLINLGSDDLQLNPIYGKLAEETSSDIYLPTLDEPQYSYYRRMIKPRLSRDTLADYLPQAIELIRATTADWQPEQAVRVQEVMTRLCIEIISRSARKYRSRR